MLSLVDGLDVIGSKEWPHNLSLYLAPPPIYAEIFD